LEGVRRTFLGSVDVQMLSEIIKILNIIGANAIIVSRRSNINIFKDVMGGAFSSCIPKRRDRYSEVTMELAELEYDC
jgi:hypothetical protein